MSLLEIILLVIVGIALVIWAVILIVKAKNRKKKQTYEEVELLEDDINKMESDE